MRRTQRKHTTRAACAAQAPIPRRPLSSPLSQGERWFLLDNCRGMPRKPGLGANGKRRPMRTGANRKPKKDGPRRCPECRARIETQFCYACHPEQFDAPRPLIRRDRRNLDKTCPEPLTLAPEVAEAARVVREEGFVDETGKFHPPWTASDYARANCYRADPVEIARLPVP